MRLTTRITLALTLVFTSLGASAETIRIAIGTQDTTINCATGGLIIRELKLLEKYLPRDGKYKNAEYNIEWKNFKSNRIDAHADFVPFAELFPNRGFARKIYDGSQANAPTYHGTLVDEAYAKKYPEIVVAYLRAAIEADRLVAAEPEKYSELIEKVTGIEAEVNYLFHGPLGLQTRDLTWKPEYRKATETAIDTLKLLKRTDKGLDIATFINDSYLREAFKQSGRDYDVALKDYSPLSLNAKDAVTGKPITDFKHLAQLWVRGEQLVRHYASFKDALLELQKLEDAGTDIRAIYAQASDSGIKLLGNQAWFVQGDKGQLDAFLLKEQAEAFAQQHGGKTFAFIELREQLSASR